VSTAGQSRVSDVGSGALATALSRPLPRPVLVVLVLLLHLGLGTYLAGGGFLSHMGSAVPALATGGGQPQYMTPGDHFEQLYRYSLPRHNLAKGRTPYWGGYQYNLKEEAPAFSEGWVFFPFSMAHALVAAIVGDVTAYNLIALLSFAMVGGAMYWLVFCLTRSHAAALLSSLILALLPHRTSFLFGEMVYGVDLALPPLIVLFFEKHARSPSLPNAALFGAFLFLYATASIQAFYLFAVFSSPYFLGRSVLILADKRMPVARFGWLLLAAIPALIYMFYVRGLIGASGLTAGQGYAETQFYSPTLANAFKVWSGNEKTVYLGWPLLAGLVFLLIFGAARAADAAARTLAVPSIFFLAMLAFVLSYLFCFGPNLDSMLGAPVYRAFFDHVPGANGTRTPGRLMGTAGFFFAMSFGIAVHLISAYWRKRFPNRVLTAAALVAAAGLGIVRDYDYVEPVMVKLEESNDAYERIRGNRGIIYPIPVQREAEHYLNATFLYYAQKYDLRIFAGHSSIYPREWNRIIGSFLPINAGRFGRTEMELFRERGITHLVAHATTFEPHVGVFAIARLKQSPYLELVAAHNGVHVFRVDTNATGAQTLDPARLVAESSLGLADAGKFHFFDGWYGREAYPGQKPFRWMHGTYASGLVFYGERARKGVRFEYKCPLHDLKIVVNGEEARGAGEGEGGWKSKGLSFAGRPETHFFVEFITAAVFKVPGDSRDFGCMIGDITVQ